MALINIDNGALAKSNVLNDNFIFLDEKIAKTAQALDAKIGLVSNNASTVTSNLANTQSTVNKLNDDLTALTESNKGKASKDLSDVTISKEFKELILNYIAPNYRYGYNIGDGFTAPNTGWVYFGGTSDGTSYVHLDGIYFEVSWDKDDGQSRGELFVFVDKGTVVNGFNRIREARFFPCKGV
jgi:hypothetical protein